MEVHVFFNDWQYSDGTPFGDWARHLPWPEGVIHGITMYEHQGDPAKGPWCPYEPAELRSPTRTSELVDSAFGAALRMGNPLDVGKRKAILDIEHWCLRRKDQQAREDGQMQWRGWKDGILDRYDAAAGRNGSNATYNSDTIGFTCRTIQRLAECGYDAAWYGFPDYNPSKTEDIAELKKHPVLNMQKWICLVHYFRDPNHTFERWRDEVIIGIQQARRMQPGKPIMILHSFNNIFSPWGFVPTDKFIKSVEFLKQGFKDVSLGIWGAIESEHYARIFTDYVREVAPALHTCIQAGEVATDPNLKKAQ